MSDTPPYKIVMEKWVEKVRADPVNHLARQATEVALNAVAAMPDFGGHLFLKGGLLMSIRYDSPRTTTDIDFTCDLRPIPETPTALQEALNKALPVAAARLGYADLRFRVQSCNQRPKKFGSPGMSFPALEMKIGYARRDSPEMARLKNDGVANPIVLEISFNEAVCNYEPLRFQESGGILLSYALTDLIAEKFRALLQQVERKHEHYRRQDVYDIALLTDLVSLSAAQRQATLDAFLIKCVARNITPTRESLAQRGVIDHARSEWSTIKQEIGELPDFDVCFAKADGLYRSPPWGLSA